MESFWPKHGRKVSTESRMGRQSVDQAAWKGKEVLVQLNRLILTLTAALGIIAGGCANYSPAALEAGNYAYQKAAGGGFGPYVAERPDRMRDLAVWETASFKSACQITSYDETTRTYVFNDDGNAKKVSDCLGGIWLGIPFCREKFKKDDAERFLEKIDGHCKPSIVDDTLSVTCEDPSKILEAMYTSNSVDKK